MAECIGWAAGPREDVIRGGQASQEPSQLQRCGPAAVLEGCEVDLAPDMLAKVGDRPGRDLVSVLLESEWGIEKDSIESRIAYPGDQFLVNGGHGRTCLARTENGDQPG